MARRARKAKDTASGAMSEHEEHVKWHKSLDERLAIRLVETWGACGKSNQTQVGRTCARELEIMLHTTDTYTKYHITVILNSYKDAK